MILGFVVDPSEQEQRTPRQAFGEVLRALRNERGLSQERLAAGSRLHRTYVSLLERCVNTPTLDAIFALARVLEVQPSDLVERTEAMVASVDAREVE